MDKLNGLWRSGGELFTLKEERQPSTAYLRVIRVQAIGDLKMTKDSAPIVLEPVMPSHNRELLLLLFIDQINLNVCRLRVGDIVDSGNWDRTQLTDVRYKYTVRVKDSSGKHMWTQHYIAESGRGRTYTMTTEAEMIWTN